MDDGSWIEEWLIAIGMALTGGGIRRQRSAGRAVVAIILVVNVVVFAVNVSWMVSKVPQGGSGRITHQAAVPPRRGPVVAKRAWEAIRSTTAKATSPLRARSQARRGPNRPAPASYVHPAPVVVSVALPENLPQLRQLVGSLHFWHPGTKVLLVEVGALSQRERHEILAWRDVRLERIEAAVAAVVHDAKINITSGPLESLRMRVARSTAPEDPGDFSKQKLFRTDVGGAGDAALIEHTLLDEADLEEFFSAVAAVSPDGRGLEQVALYYGLLSHRTALLLAPGVRLTGWCDNVFKALQRDGWFFIQDAAVGGGCSPVAQGYRLGSPTVALLRRHVQCALAAECPTAESLRQGVVASVGNWWGLPPTKAEGLGLECYDSSVAKLWSEEFETGDEKDDEEDDGARGAGKKLDLPRLRNAPQLKIDYRCTVLIRPGLGRMDVNMEPWPVDDVLRPEGAAPDEPALSAVTSADGSVDPGDGVGARPTRIVIGIAATTAGIDSATAEALPLVAVMVPSLLGSVEQGAGRYTFHLYVGYDEGDPVFDNASALAKLRRRLRTVIGSYPVGFRTVRFPSVGSPTAVWNGLFELAVRDGADYFLAAHDDTEFFPPVKGGAYWADQLVGSLKTNPLLPNLGVAGPLDAVRPHVVSHPLLHRLHWDIFGRLFPEALPAGAAMDWVSVVYGYKNTFMPPGLKVLNSRKRRHVSRPCRLPPHVLDFEVGAGRDALKQYVLKRYNLSELCTGSYCPSVGREITSMLE